MYAVFNFDLARTRTQYKYFVTYSQINVALTFCLPLSLAHKLLFNITSFLKQFKNIFNTKDTAVYKPFFEVAYHNISGPCLKFISLVLCYKFKGILACIDLTARFG